MKINYFLVSLINLKSVSKSFFIPWSKFVADKYSVNSACEKDSKNSSSLINLFFGGCIAAYLWLFILTIFALLLLLLFDAYTTLLFSSITVNETLGLVISNSLSVLWVKIYLSLYFFSLDVLSRWGIRSG